MWVETQTRVLFNDEVPVEQPSRTTTNNDASEGEGCYHSTWRPSRAEKTLTAENYVTFSHRPYRLFRVAVSCSVPILTPSYNKAFTTIRALYVLGYPMSEFEAF